MTNEQKIREALSLVREALQLANDTPNGGITDTIWMPHAPQTLFDFIDEALAQPAAVVELTDREMPILPPVEVGGFGNGPFRYTDRQMMAYGRSSIAAHEAKQGGAA